MNPALSAPDRPASAAALRQQVKEIMARWEEGAPPDALEALRDNPALAADHMAPVDLAYMEFRLRHEAGEDLDPTAFCDRFPEHRATLHRMLNFDAALSDAEGPLPSLSLLPLAPVRWPEPGAAVGDWTLLRELGRGSFARVFLATEASTGDRPVVVKLSLCGDLEARTLGRLAHPHVVPILSCHHNGASGLTVVCMPFLGCATLDHVQNQLHRRPGGRPRHARSLLEAARSAGRDGDPAAAAGPPDARLLRGSFADGVLHLGAQLADALAFLHGRGVVHRDLKPSNVLLGPDGCPRLLDFNLAGERIAETAFVGGTVTYAAPEHIRAMLAASPDVAGPDERSDVFSLGVILYELLTGRHPFGDPPPDLRSRELGEWVIRRQQAGCPLPQAPGLDLPAARLLVRCLAFDPAQRPASAAALAGGLREAFTIRRRLNRWVGRRRSLIAGAGLALLALAILVGSWGRVPATAPSADAEPRSAAEAFHAGNYEQAERYFTDLLSAAPGDARALFARGCVRLRHSRMSLAWAAEREMLDRASKDFDIVLKAGPDPQASLCNAYCWARQDRHERALFYCEQAARAGVESAALRNNRAYSYLKKNNLASAEADLRAIDAEHQDLPAVCYNRVVLALVRKTRAPDSFLAAGSLRDIRRVLAAGPPDAVLYKDAAHVFAYSAADTGRWMAALSRPLDAFPGDAFPLGSLSAVREDLLREAVRHLRLAIEHGGASPALDSDAWACLRGRPDFKTLRQLTAPAVPPDSRTLRLIDPTPDRLD